VELHAENVAAIQTPGSQLIYELSEIAHDDGRSWRVHHARGADGLATD